MRKFSFSLAKISGEKFDEILNRTILFRNTKFYITDETLDVYTEDEIFIPYLRREKLALSVA